MNEHGTVTAACRQRAGRRTIHQSGRLRGRAFARRRLGRVERVTGEPAGARDAAMEPTTGRPIILAQQSGTVRAPALRFARRG